ncbi:LuxR C-terminal-related transcriptional regulator [Emticicia fluvialis]|uniref:LuxR C-terminal-related transcriptional regulator n=1 Tax=Emticicia fluvialis TaxID=2974474 RepID=UPI002166BE5B|nr:LuxR C-terminal-related transcriptional regulator [Emticicia fluvialis]
MEKPRENYYLEARKIWSTVVDQDSTDFNDLRVQVAFHKQLLNIFQPGNYHYFVFNIFKVEVELWSEGIIDVLGYTPDEMSLEFYMSIIHPDDMPYFLKFEKRITEFFLTLPYDKIKNYKVQYDIRLRAKDNRYVRVLHQAIQIDYDANNFYRTLDVQSDITHIKSEGVPCFSLIGMDGEPSYYNIQSDSLIPGGNNPFSEREQEILKMIVEGKSSKEIAGVLFLSLHTVNTHRKNILNKARVKTPVELVTKVINQGWI